MNFTTDYRLENFILQTQWADIPAPVQERLRGCMLDLLGALVAGSGSGQFAAGLALARRAFRSGDIAVIGAADTFDFLGASAAMGHASNAYDIDDGHNIIRAHPGTSFIGGLLAAGYECDLNAQDFLAALYVSYETTIRMARPSWTTTSMPTPAGTFGAVGVAAGAGRIYGLDRAALNNILSIAEFNAPLVPGIRSVEYPSMNKDGVPFGVMIGALALLADQCGFTGNKHLLEADEYRRYLDDLGQNHEVMALYFKPYPCCRWGHPAIDACLALMAEHHVTAQDIKSVTVETFYKATQLSKGIPSCADAAQYNIAYPVAAAIVNNGFSIQQVENTNDDAVIDMMGRLSFVCDPELDAQFPARRLCRAAMVLKDGRRIVSDVHEPRGEACENIGYDWLADKFHRITAHRLTSPQQEVFIQRLHNDDWTVRQLISQVNAALL